MAMTVPVKLTLGPVFFNWSPEKWRDFYFRIADESVFDSVCVGEVVCAKRQSFFEPVLADVVERLEGAGKEVVLSTLALVMDDREMQAVKALAADDQRLVEANDISGAALLAGRRHVVGPLVNVYNEGTLGYIADNGAIRVCLPVELPGSAIGVLAEAARARKVEIEVMAFGRLPLAISARCYHARAGGLNKDSCRYVCAADADGMDLETLDGEPFLAVNGTQTLSYGCHNLIAEAGALGEMGVHRLRLSPQDMDMPAIAAVFRDVLDGRESAEAGRRRLDELALGMAFVNGYFHGREGSLRVGPSPLAE